MSGRLVERFVPLGGPSWRLEIEPALSWRLGDELYRSALLDMPVEAPLVVPPGPMAPPPAGLAPISDLGVVDGVAVPFNRFTEIRDKSGHYMERFAPGAFTKTLQDHGQHPVALFSHGMDGSVGYKSLGKLSAFEASDGLRFGIALLDAPYVAEVAAGMRHGLYGASIRFQSEVDRARSRPGRSEVNPQGIPEVTVTQARLSEISIVAMPAYPGTSANLN